tara:strand:+ start:14770 stop:15111 length:342 start_codon:yes stop_codon:yes gene_type:complete
MNFLKKLFKNKPVNETTVYARFRFKDGKKSEFVNMLSSEEGLVKTRNFKGCLSIECYEDINDCNTLIIYQKWDSKEDHCKYLEWRKETGLLDALSDMLDEPLVPVYLTFVPGL